MNTWMLQINVNKWTWNTVVSSKANDNLASYRTWHTSTEPVCVPVILTVASGLTSRFTRIFRVVSLNLFFALYSERTASPAGVACKIRSINWKKIHKVKIIKLYAKTEHFAISWVFFSNQLSTVFRGQPCFYHNPYPSTDNSKRGIKLILIISLWHKVNSHISGTKFSLAINPIRLYLV